MYVVSKMSMGKPLPLSLYSRIKEVPGITKVDYGSWFQAIYQDPKNSIFAEAHTDNYYDLYTELEISPATRQALLRTRTGIVAGESLAKKFNWKIGDKVPLQTSAVQKDGSNTWTFDLVGLYRYKDPNLKMFESGLYTNWDSFDEARRSENGTVNFYLIKAVNPDEADRVAQAVDALSANSDHETRTQSDNATAAAVIRQYGDVGVIVTSIMGAVFFTLLLLTGHMMAQAIHERIPEVAVLKTMGFTGRTIMGLVLGESVLVLLLGSTIGLGIATFAIGEVRSVLEDTLPIVLLPVGETVWLQGLAFAVVIGLIVGAPPALRGMRLRIVDGLSGH
jgi:putative ABC transport system permease protein